MVDGKITGIRAYRDPHNDLLDINGISDLERGRLSLDIFGEDGNKVYNTNFQTKLDGSWGPIVGGILQKIPTQKLTVVLKTKDRTETLDTQIFSWEGFLKSKPLSMTQNTLKAEAEISVANLISKLEKSLRKVVGNDKPKKEFDVHDAIEKLLVGTNYEDTYTRDVEAIPFSVRSYKPDFVFEEIKLALEVKFCDSKDDVNKIIKEMNDDINPYKKRYLNIIFVIYDLGYIPNIDEFVNDFHKIEKIRVIIIKH